MTDIRIRDWFAEIGRTDLDPKIKDRLDKATEEQIALAKQALADEKLREEGGDPEAERERRENEGQVNAREPGAGGTNVVAPSDANTPLLG